MRETIKFRKIEEYCLPTDYLKIYPLLLEGSEIINGILCGFIKSAADTSVAATAELQPQGGVVLHPEHVPLATHKQQLEEVGWNKFT